MYLTIKLPIQLNIFEDHNVLRRLTSLKGLINRNSEENFTRSKPNFRITCTHFNCFVKENTVGNVLQYILFCLKLL